MRKFDEDLQTIRTVPGTVRLLTETESGVDFGMLVESEQSRGEGGGEVDLMARELRGRWRGLPGLRG